MGLMADVGPGPVALDTAVFIYFIEENPRYLDAIAPLFAAVDSLSTTAVISAVTLLEVLVLPLRAGNSALAQQYEALLTRSRGLRLVPMSRRLMRVAAYLRAHTHMKTPDALQIAAAVRLGCTAFITNDRRLPSIPGLKIVQLSDYA